MSDTLTMFKKVPSWVWIAGALGVALWVSKKGVSGVVADVTGGVIKGSGEVAGGVVKGIGSVLGVPDTDRAKCEACIRKGDDWGASKYCTVGQLAKWEALSVRKRIFGTPFTVNDVFD